MKIITASKIIIIVILMLIIFKSKEGMKCKMNYLSLHPRLNDKLLINKYKGEIDCNNKLFSDYCECTN